MQVGRVPKVRVVAAACSARFFSDLCGALAWLDGTSAVAVTDAAHIQLLDVVLY